jgi:hypothetical protein
MNIVLHVHLMDTHTFRLTCVCPKPLLTQGLIGLLRHGESDAWLALGLMQHLSVLPLTKALTNLSGSLWSKALQVGGAEGRIISHLNMISELGAYGLPCTLALDPSAQCHMATDLASK